MRDIKLYVLLNFFIFYTTVYDSFIAYGTVWNDDSPRLKISNNYMPKSDLFHYVRLRSHSYYLFHSKRFE